MISGNALSLHWLHEFWKLHHHRTLHAYHHPDFYLDFFSALCRCFWTCICLTWVINVVDWWNQFTWQKLSGCMYLQWSKNWQVAEELTWREKWTGLSCQSIDVCWKACNFGPKRYWDPLLYTLWALEIVKMEEIALQGKINFTYRWKWRWILGWHCKFL